MGFEADQVIKALSMSNNNVEQVFGDRSGVFHFVSNKPKNYLVHRLQILFSVERH